jgi:hypothetical protein
MLLSVPNDSDRAFIRSLYEPASEKKTGLYGAGGTGGEAISQRLVLKSGVDASGDLARYWDILAAAGRMNLRISTVIDIREGAAIRHVNQLIDVIAVGVVNSPDPKNNINVGYLPLDVLQDEAGLMLDGRITELLIREKNARDAALPGSSESPAVITAALAGMVLPPELAVYRWLDYAADYISVSQADDISSRIIILLLFILSFLGIANTMLMAILERTRETGMMRALGMTDGQLILTYMIEAGLVGFIGSLSGITLGCLINIPMVKYGVDFSGLTAETGGDIGYRIASNFKSAWNIPVIIGSGVAATLLASCMAFFPTRRALSMPVTESLRFE